MGVKLEGETMVSIRPDDLLAILTEHFCGSSYDAFANLRASSCSETSEGDFEITFYPKPKPEPEAK